jgi:1-acyl-sn-glycerol-3-phosphate acyltransferase
MREALGKAILDRAGWTIGSDRPSSDRFVLVAAPHTSNWDFLYCIACTTAFGLPLRFMAKDSLFRGPQGGVLRALGGIPIDRSKNNNVVDATVRSFQETRELVVLIPPEGTRKAGEYWKSGFYHIARKANVPVGLGFLDYARKQVGIGPLLALSGDVKRDMDEIRAFYADKAPKHPAMYTPPRLREEEKTA